MTKFIITFGLTGGVSIKAKSIEDAIKKFDKIDSNTLYENAGDFEIIDISEEKQTH